MVMYVLRGICGAVLKFFFLLRELFSGRAVQVLKWIAIKIWSGLCAFASTVFNAAVYGAVIFALVWIVDKTNLLSPEYLTFFHDIIQLIK